jgi:acetyl-CoA carboxylase carboxyl transferase subunit beta
MVDLVVHRHELRATLGTICRLLTKSKPGKKRHTLPAPAEAVAAST